MDQFKFYTPENSEGSAKKILSNVKTKYGFVPTLFGYMAEAPYTIEAYAMLTALLEKTGLSAPQQQVALLAVSSYNKCGFCKIAHQAFAKMNKANPQTIDAIVNNGDIDDASDKAIVDMVVAITDQRGWIKQQQLNDFLAAGFTRQNVYDLILVVTIKTLSNYSNHLTKPEANDELKAML